MGNIKLEIRDFKKPNLEEENLEIFNKNLESDLKKIEKIPLVGFKEEYKMGENGYFSVREVQVIVTPKSIERPWGYFFFDTLQSKSNKLDLKVNLGGHYITSNELRIKHF